jgi:hypothetical protein
MDEAGLHLATADGAGDVGIAAQVLAFVEPGPTLFVPTAAFSVLALSVAGAAFFGIALSVPGGSFAVAGIALSIAVIRAAPWLSRG